MQLGNVLPQAKIVELTQLKNELSAACLGKIIPLIWMNLSILFEVYTMKPECSAIKWKYFRRICYCYFFCYLLLKKINIFLVYPVWIVF